MASQKFLVETASCKECSCTVESDKYLLDICVATGGSKHRDIYLCPSPVPKEFLSPSEEILSELCVKGTFVQEWVSKTNSV